MLLCLYLAIVITLHISCTLVKETCDSQLDCDFMLLDTTRHKIICNSYIFAISQELLHTQSKLAWLEIEANRYLADRPLLGGQFLKLNLQI